MHSAIHIEGLGKKYQLRKAGSYLSLREGLMGSFRKGMRFNNKKEEFWALDDINLDIDAGDTIGIIGRNGSGKTTLLKLISRITQPTTGCIVMTGRVASLLEVGTGFHPELTGRENIFFNGSILGLKKKEISQRLDEIVDFSGVEKFIDMPLKHYSSGMQMRLAFSVAAHLEPDILLIDEVLAVGDLEFQKKCMKKMKEISTAQGRTVLFVSHNLKAVSELCNKAALLHSGKLQCFDNVNHSIDRYVASLGNGEESQSHYQMLVRDDIGISAAWVFDAQENRKYQYYHSGKIGLAIRVKNNSWPHRFTIGMGLNSLSKGRIFINFKECNAMEANNERIFTTWLPSEELTPGIYTIDLSVLDHRNTTLNLITDAISFEILLSNSKFEGLGYDYGIFTKELDWKDL